ncbi:GT4 family glycosyltransferase PelF [Nitrosophilus alvini]|uniref:GT4 family glycosyltransferase PelF n=1 Tax=Nitrosophilus alvini TaxID=2714855 RepID=UPI001F48575D|nr:GT4 family glycosyltransferase PelF [Nitrosophilus alvini]
MINFFKKKEIDVLIVAEGTYPYIRGGVSTWIHQLITGMPDINFGIVFLGSKKEDYGDIVYDLPKNLVYLETEYLFGNSHRFEPEIMNGSNKKFEDIIKLQNWFRKKELSPMPQNIKNIDFYLKHITKKEFLYSKNSWDIIQSEYLSFTPESAFIDYFWTVRNMHSPIWNVASIASKIKCFKIVHSPSTGYAGFLGALLGFNYKKPFILTEHGIYTRERKIDMLNADWLIDNRTIFQKELGTISHIKNMWIKFFEGIGKISYEAANPIISLFENARKIQIAYGAAPEKTKVVPNGIDIEKFKKLRHLRKEKIPKVITLIGRVVPIKDIKTFIKAMRIAANRIKDIEGWIVGPENEDPDYAKECRLLVETLGLKNHIKFLGFQRVEDILPKTGILTLSSISEGMPLVVIEGFGAGVPAVTTDVGSCSQLIYGGIDEEDRKIGSAGEVVPIANPSKLAQAYIKLFENENLWEKCQSNAIKRVETYYTMEVFLNNYKNIYTEAIQNWQV